MILPNSNHNNVNFEYLHYKIVDLVHFSEVGTVNSKQLGKWDVWLHSKLQCAIIDTFDYLLMGKYKRYFWILIVMQKLCFSSKVCISFFWKTGVKIGTAWFSQVYNYLAAYRRNMVCTCMYSCFILCVGALCTHFSSLSRLVFISFVPRMMSYHTQYFQANVTSTESEKM